MVVKVFILFASLVCLRGVLASSLSCGDWQGAYTKLHRDIIAGRRAPRYAVNVAAEAGEHKVRG